MADMLFGTFLHTVWADLPPKLILGEYILDRPVPSLVVAADACGEYEIKALPTGRISGQVLAKDGTGVSGWDASDIQLFRADKYKENARAWEDRGWLNFPKDRGYFEFKHVAPGDYVIVYNPSNVICAAQFSKNLLSLSRRPRTRDTNSCRRGAMGEGRCRSCGRKISAPVKSSIKAEWQKTTLIDTATGF
jgi:hypothetical protein